VKNNFKPLNNFNKMKKIAVVTILVLTLIVTCKSQIENKFVDYSDNPVVLASGAEGEWDSGAIGSTCILKVGDTFHAYYEAWGPDDAALKINGRKVPRGKDFRFGIEYDVEGNANLIVWVKIKAKEETKISLTSVK